MQSNLGYCLTTSFASGGKGQYFWGSGVSTGHPDDDFLLRVPVIVLELRVDVYRRIVSRAAFPQVANKKRKRHQTIADGFPDCISADAFRLSCATLALFTRLRAKPAQA